MSLEQTARMCISCDEQRLHVRQGVNHVLHLLLTVLTGGLWAIIWLALALALKPSWRCGRCGSIN